RTSRGSVENNEPPAPIVLDRGRARRGSGALLHLPDPQSAPCKAPAPPLAAAPESAMQRLLLSTPGRDLVRTAAQSRSIGALRRGVRMPAAPSRWRSAPMGPGAHP